MSREHIPPRPSGSERESRFMQSVHDKTHGQSERIIDSDTIKVRRTTRGISLHAKPQKKGGSESVTLKKFYYQSSMGDYLWCTDIKSTDTGTPVYTAIAKNTKLRNSIASENIDGTTVTYDYSPYTVEGQKYLRRDASIAGNSVIEKQDINPRFILNDAVYAMKVDGGAGINTQQTDPKNTTAGTAQAIEYIDMNVDARAWTQRDDQST